MGSAAARAGRRCRRRASCRGPNSRSSRRRAWRGAKMSSLAAVAAVRAACRRRTSTAGRRRRQRGRCPTPSRSGCRSCTFHQPAAGVVEGPSSSATAVPHGIDASMAAEVPTPLRRFSAVAVTRACRRARAWRRPGRGRRRSGSPSSPRSLAAQPVHAMHAARAAAAVIRIIAGHDSIRSWSSFHAVHTFVSPDFVCLHARQPRRPRRQRRKWRQRREPAARPAAGGAAAAPAARQAAAAARAAPRPGDVDSARHGAVAARHGHARRRRLRPGICTERRATAASTTAASTARRQNSCSGGSHPVAVRVRRAGRLPRRCGRLTRRMLRQYVGVGVRRRPARTCPARRRCAIRWRTARRAPVMPAAARSCSCRSIAFAPSKPASALRGRRLRRPRHDGARPRLDDGRPLRGGRVRAVCRSVLRHRRLRQDGPVPRARGADPSVVRL